jgi:hypothetical protein
VSAASPQWKTTAPEAAGSRWEDTSPANAYIFISDHITTLKQIAEEKYKKRNEKKRKRKKRKKNGYHTMFQYNSFLLNLLMMSVSCGTPTSREISLTSKVNRFWRT